VKPEAAEMHLPLALATTLSVVCLLTSASFSGSPAFRASEKPRELFLPADLRSGLHY